MNLYLKRLFVTRIRKILFAASVIIVALGAIVYGYWASLPSPTGPKVTLTSPPFELSMSLDKTAYSLNDNMTITFYLCNISNQTITVGESHPQFVSPTDAAITFASASEGVNTSYSIPGENPLGGEFPFSFTLVAGNGTVVDKYPGGLYPAVTIDIFFEPGASLNQTLSINLTQYSASHTAPIGYPLQKGAYQISAAFYGWFNDEGPYTLETPSITFTLAPYLRRSSLPSPTGPKVTFISPPLQLSLSLDGVNYQPGDNMTVGFSLRNISNRTVTVTKGSYSSVGLGHYDPVFNLTTTAEGVSTAYPDELDNRFHFGYTLFNNNETIDHEPVLVYNEVYDIHLEPEGTLNQTFKLSLPEFWANLKALGTSIPQTGTFQIRASLFNFWVDGITAPSLTIETPSIAFTLGQ